MPFSQADIDTLKEAIATGAESVAFGAGPDRREIKYRNFSAMKEALAMVTAEVHPTSVAPMRTVGEYHSGLMPFCDPWSGR